MLCMLLTALSVHAQSPELLNYQAVIRNSSGELMVYQAVYIEISIIDNNANGDILFTESHNKTTNAYGLVNLVIGTGTPVLNGFSDIDWNVDKKFVGVKVNAGFGLTDLGAFQLLSVPYALHANSASKLGDENIYIPQPDTLFAVKDHEGNVVFAVFPDGVKVIVEEATKGSVGGFAVSGRSPTKADETDIFRVTPDSTRIYVNDTVQSKGTVGGFAVSGRSPTKGLNNEYLVVTLDSTRIYVSDTSLSKGTVGGFAVSGRSPTKSGIKDYFNISGSSEVDTVNSDARILWYPKKEAFLTGRVLVESPDSVGTNSLATGFESKAVGNFSQAMGYQSISRGAYSTAIGYQALTNDSNSFAFGNYAEALGINSFAFGDSAIVTAEDAYAIGAYAYASGRGSFAIGSKDRYYTDDSELRTIATGELSMAVGLDADATGFQSIAVGNGVYATGDYSVALGRSSIASGQFGFAMNGGQATNTGSIAIGGVSSGYASLSIGNNTSSGWLSSAIGYSCTASGESSTAIGYKATSTGTYANAIGNNITAQSSGSFVCGYYNIKESTNQLFVVGNGTYLTSSNALTVFKTGDMSLKGNFYPVTDNSYNLGTSTYRWKTVYSAGGVVTTSDQRLKTNIKGLSYGLNEILKLRPVTFEWIQNSDGALNIGLIAQEVQPILNEVVNVGDDENQTLGINYSGIVPVLIKGMQEQQVQIVDLKNENKELKKENEDIKARLEEIEKLLMNK